MTETRRMYSGGRCSKEGPCKDTACKKCYRDVSIPKKKDEKITKDANYGEYSKAR